MSLVVMNLQRIITFLSIASFKAVLYGYIKLIIISA